MTEHPPAHCWDPTGTHFPSLSLCFSLLQAGVRGKPGGSRLAGGGSHLRAPAGGRRPLNGRQGPGRGQGAGGGQELFWAFLPRHRGARGSDGKRPSCLPGQDVSCTGLSRAEPGRCPPQAFPRGLCSSATLAQCPCAPPWLPRQPLTAPCCRLGSRGS